MFVVQEWMWMAVALLAVTFAGTLRSLFFAWLSVAATVVGTLIWFDATVPLLHQLLLLGVITFGGVAISQFFVKPMPEDEAAASEEDEEPIKAPNPAKVINKTFTLTEPIVNGFGTLEIDGTLWKLRGEDSQAGEQIRVLGVDGLQLDVLIVTKEEWAEDYVYRGGED